MTSEGKTTVSTLHTATIHVTTRKNLRLAKRPENLSWALGVREDSSFCFLRISPNTLTRVVRKMAR